MNFQTRKLTAFGLVLASDDSLAKAKVTFMKTHGHKTRNQNARKTSFSVYFAGDLWTHKDLIGNALLGAYISEVSHGRYHCVLPQDLEEPVNRTVDIRNIDLKHVMTSDMAIFNFDGANLDSGTVVEFIYAKMLDIPCVLLRTDFRAAGEGNQDQDPWNLMASHWPRSKVLRIHAMAEYQTANAAGDSLSRTLKRLYRKIAVQLVECLDAARLEKPLVQPENLSVLYEWALQCPGAGYGELFTRDELKELISAKAAKHLVCTDKS